MPYEIERAIARGITRQPSNSRELKNVSKHNKREVFKSVPSICCDVILSGNEREHT
jgi:hypothetical protein